jgi:SAM-dependent methyltransferase
VTDDLRAFVRANLPPPPARVLEVGAGSGELARWLTAAGYEVVAIDPEPGADNVDRVALADVTEPPGSFDAAVAVLSLHHVDPLARSCERLAELVRPGGILVVDEFDVAEFDERAASWWLDQRRALGESEDHEHAAMVDDLRAELHSSVRICETLAAGFEVSRPLRGSYLYRWDLDESLRPVEEELIAQGELPAVGVRFVAVRAPTLGRVP